MKCYSLERQARTPTATRLSKPKGLKVIVGMTTQNGARHAGRVEVVGLGLPDAGA